MRKRTPRRSVVIPAPLWQRALACAQEETDQRGHPVYASDIVREALEQYLSAKRTRAKRAA